MEKARVAIFEDSEQLRNLYKALIARSRLGHIVVAEAASLPEAIGVLNQHDSGDLFIDAIVLDGNLSEGDTSGSDAKEIVSRTRYLSPRPKTIGLSEFQMEKDYGIHVDIDITKPTLTSDIHSLERALDEL
jgi:hypothetical protein